MNLDKVVEIAQEKYNAARYDELRRGDILMHFLREEMGLTPEKFREIFQTGKTKAKGFVSEEYNLARFLRWYYINYVIDHLVEDC